MVSTISLEHNDDFGTRSAMNGLPNGLLLLITKTGSTLAAENHYNLYNRRSSAVTTTLTTLNAFKSISAARSRKERCNTRGA